jgi:hypothetical protein
MYSAERGGTRFRVETRVLLTGRQVVGLQRACALAGRRKLSWRIIPRKDRARSEEHRQSLRVVMGALSGWYRHSARNGLTGEAGGGRIGAEQPRDRVIPTGLDEVTSKRRPLATPEFVQCSCRGGRRVLAP